MVKLFNFIIILVAAILIVHCVLGEAFACFGGRPMAMGGAFSGLADDVHAVYWNPAGLGQIKEKQAAYAGAFPGSRDNYNHDDFLAFVFPLANKEDDFGTLGIWFANSGFKKPTFKETELWYALSYGKQINDNLFVGISGKYETYSKKNGIGEDSDSLGTISLGFLYKIDKLSFGVFIQDMNKAARQVFNQTYRHVVNVRPGMAYQLDEKTLITMDVYDAAGETKKYNPDISQDLRFGVEHWIDESIAIRVGGYHLNSASDEMKAITGGFGYKPRNGMFNQREISFDYAVMYWADPPSGTGHYTHQAGVVIKF